MINPLEALEEDDPSPFEGDSNDDSEELQEAFGEMSRETLLAFGGALLFAHVGLLATSVGLLLVVFSGQWTVGGAIALVGIAALALTGWIYRWYEEAK